MSRPLAALLALAALAAAPVALGAPAPTAPAPTAAPAPVVPPPALDSLRLPAVVSAQQGHARFLVGLRLATPAKLTTQVVAARGGRVVRTLTDTAARPAGRAYLRIEAVDAAGFQLLRGAYRLRIHATDDQGRVSPALEGAFRLTLTPPRGTFDAYTLPFWRGFHRQAGTAVAGQLIAVVAPKGSAASAGLRRGDVVTSVDGRAITGPGTWSAAMRALPANRPVAIGFVRAGAPATATLTAKPDWVPVPDYAASLLVAARREPRVLAVGIARARQLVDAGKLTDARAVIAAWPRAWRSSAPGQLVQAELLARQTRWKQALGAYNRARARDSAMAAAEFGRGVSLSALAKQGPSGIAFAAAVRLDPGDPAAAGFRAYALINSGRTTEALEAARTAVRLDPRYADAFLPFGISLLAVGDRAGGIKALRRGLVLLEESDRANALIRQHLDPADP